MPMREKASARSRALKSPGLLAFSGVWQCRVCSVDSTHGALFFSSIRGSRRAVYSFRLIIDLDHARDRAFGVKRALVLNLTSSMLNLVMIGVILALMARAVKMERLLFDFWGARAQLGSVLTQLKSTMLVTLWTFIGVEGAVVLSGRALKPAHIGVATFAGLAICAGLYVSMSVLPF